MVKCQQCGREFTTESGDPAQRQPCPDCGSLARAYTIHAQDGVLITGSADVVLTKSSPSVLLQAVVTFGDKTTEGRIIEAVAAPWLEILKLIEKDKSIIYQIDPRKWEELIAGWYKEYGFDEVTLTPRSGDLGRDVIAVKHGVLSVRILDQVKAYGPEHLVPANDVRALLGVLGSDHAATKGLVTTTSDFAPKIESDPLIATHLPTRLELVNGTELVRRLGEASKKKT
jgi:restriction system protein